MTPPSRIQWLSDLIRLEITIWDRINARLKTHHALPIAFFEALYFISRTHEGRPRVGQLAQAMRITVGGASKLVDRVERAGLLRREADAEDRRTSLLVLTEAGERALVDASATYERELTAVLDSCLSAAEQRQMHALVRRLLAAIREREDA